MYDGPIFDVQTHAILPDAYDRVTGAINNSIFLTDGTKHIMTNEICKLLGDNLVSPARLRALENGNVHVVSVNTFFEPLPASQLLSICDRINTWMATAVTNRPDLIGIATVPPPPLIARAGPYYVEKALKMLRKAIKELGLRGVLLASNYDNIFLGDTCFLPYFAALQQLDVPIIIHPAVKPVEEQFVPQKNISGLSGFLNDQRTALLDLVMAGVLEMYPGLKIVATHLGGGVLSSLGRFDVVLGRFPDESWYINEDGASRLLSHSIAHYLKKIYYDCNTSDKEDIEHAVTKVGADHLLTGTDFPWMDDSFARKTLAQVREKDVVRNIAYNNAAHLFSTRGLSVQHAL